MEPFLLVLRDGTPEEGRRFMIERITVVAPPATEARMLALWQGIAEEIIGPAPAYILIADAWKVTTADAAATRRVIAEGVAMQPDRQDTIVAIFQAADGMQVVRSYAVTRDTGAVCLGPGETQPAAVAGVLANLYDFRGRGTEVLQ